MIWALVLLFGLGAGVVGGVIGFGGSTILLPVLAFAFGPKEAVPVMAIAGLLANLSRVLVWWREVDWRCCAAYAATGIPFAALGAATLVRMDARWLEAALGAFLLAMIPARRWFAHHGLRISLPQMGVVGAVLGFLTGIVATTGPVNAPFFLAYGLLKGAYISTEAAASAAVFLTKSATFRLLGALPTDTLVRGLIVGAAMMGGAWLAKRFVTRLHPDQFRGLIEAVLLIAGLSMLASASW